jgi:hypothetical protein
MAGYDPHVEIINKYTIQLSEDDNEWQVWWHGELVSVHDTYREAATKVKEFTIFNEHVRQTVKDVAHERDTESDTVRNAAYAMPHSKKR